MALKKLKIFLSLFCVFVVSIGNSQSLTDLIKNGFLNITSGNFQTAEQDFASAIRVNVPLVDAYVTKLKKYNVMNDYQKTTSDMPDGFLYNHDYAVPYYGHAMALKGLGKHDEAVVDFDKAILIDPKYADAICEKAIILIAKGAKEKGCIELRKAKMLGSERAKTMYEKNACSDASFLFVTSGNAKFSAKDYSGAITDYTNAIELNSDSTQPFIKRGECYFELKKYNEAITEYNKALKLKSDTILILFNRGLAYNANENFKEAFADLTFVIRNSVNNYEAYMQRAIACEGMQNVRSAIFDYSEAIRIKPKDGMAYYKRGLITQDAKDNSACKDFKMAVSLGFDDAGSMAAGCVTPGKKK